MSENPRKLGPRSKFGPATHVEPTAPGKVGHQGGHGPDPALASWSHFTLDIAQRYNRGHGGFYEERVHKYNPNFINPTRYQLELSAKFGLTLNKTSAIPKDLVAYAWTVSTADGGFHETKIIQRPISPMEQAVFELPPRPDTYDVRLKVAFANGKFAERQVRFDVRDWFIVSLGDSSASGQGNPDVTGSLGLTGGTGAIIQP